MNAQHTPTPWEISGSQCRAEEVYGHVDIHAYVVDQDRGYWRMNNGERVLSNASSDIHICTVIGYSPEATFNVAVANAAHIVRAVNAHDALVAALKNITAVAGNLPDDLLAMRTGPNDAAARGLMIVSAREIARVALAAAGEGA